MKFIADLHVHSKYSIATAKNLDLENLYIAAQLKGIDVVGTGDFTHPAWFAEIKAKLERAEDGLFKLKRDIATRCDEQVPLSCRRSIRFTLQTEISNVYKKDSKTRKNHNLVFFENMEKAFVFNQKLDRLGNIRSDGRPILGLDARDLLEIVLETSPQAYLIPAHIWTPWFSVLGSKSGFDSIKDCFQDLTPHIFAAETGLSSDPAMNRRISNLDHITLVSNSDAHSPLKIGREANIFNTELTFQSIKNAIKKGDKDSFSGTIEFYPEEGKYHLDGHRKCGVRSWPEKTLKGGGQCPVCAKPLTLGVLYRIEALSDRESGYQPPQRIPFYRMIPLTQILSEILGVGPDTKTVKTNYIRVLKRLGPELQLLYQLPMEEIKKAGIPLLETAIERMRREDIRILPGYDGEYGKVRIFEEGERKKIMGQRPLFDRGFEHKKRQDDRLPRLERQRLSDWPNSKSAHRRLLKNGLEKADEPAHDSSSIDPSSEKKITLNRDQLDAVQYGSGALLVVAGPGTGKTLTITHRIAHLITHRRCAPENILAVTFTKKAAEEMQRRLRLILGERARPPLTTTFHALCLQILRSQHPGKSVTVVDEIDQKLILLDVIKIAIDQGIEVPLKTGRIMKHIIDTKQHIQECTDDDGTIPEDIKAPLMTILKMYQKALAMDNLYDYEDLIVHTVRLFEKDARFLHAYRDKFNYIFIDEYQDINRGQYRLMELLAPHGEATPNICAIGDPNQSIYRFRGSDSRYFKRFEEDYPKAGVIRLTRNYRSTETILRASNDILKSFWETPQTFCQATGGISLHTTANSGASSRIKERINLSVVKTANETNEAETIAEMIEQMVGGTGYHCLDTGRIETFQNSKHRVYSDFAVLYRTGEQQRHFSRVFNRRGIPHQTVSKEKMIHTDGISHLISLLKIITGRGNMVDLKRTLTAIGAGLGKKTLHRLQSWAFKRGFGLEETLINTERFPISDMNRNYQLQLMRCLKKVSQIKAHIHGMSLKDIINYLLEKTGVLEKIPPQTDRSVTEDRLALLIELADRYPHVDDFLANLSLNSDTDYYSFQVEKTALMSMHAAKGLEFPIVFISGCETGLIPFEHPGGGEPEIDEERRLFYVAMTRAREALYLCYAARRRVYGKVVQKTVSPFVEEIEKHRLTYEKSLPRLRKKRQQQLQLF